MTRSACQSHCPRSSAPSGPISTKLPAICHRANRTSTTPVSRANPAAATSRGRDVRSAATAAAARPTAEIVAVCQDSSRLTTGQASIPRAGGPVPLRASPHIPSSQKPVVHSPFTPWAVGSRATPAGTRKDPGGGAHRRHQDHGQMGQGRWHGLGWICHLPRAVPLIHALTGLGIQYLYVNTASKPPASTPAQSRAPSWAWMYPVPPGPVSTATSCGGQTEKTRQRAAYVLTCLICLLCVLFIDANASKPVVRSLGFPRFSWTHSKSHSQVLTPPALVWQVLFTIRERVITFA